VTLNVRLISYLAAVHVAMAAVLLWQRWALGWWPFLLEIVLLSSFLLGLKWIRALAAQAGVARAFIDVVAAGEYGVRYPPIANREVDGVIEIYNRVLAALQQERFRIGEQRGFAEKFLQDTPAGVLIFDFDDRITLANLRARALLGLAGDAELAGRALHELDSPIAKTVATLAIDETRMITDGAGRRLRCRLAQFADRGFARSYVLIEELTAEINRSERETYEKLIRMMAHEVTNTVAATNSLLESCRTYAKQLGDAESRADYENALDVAITRNRNLNEFTRGFSDLVKLPQPRREDVDICEMLRAMHTMFRAELERRNIGLDMSVADDLPRVSMDRNQMDQVLMNVIKNAAEAIDRDGRIEIVATRGAGFVDLSVSDTGPGLSDEIKKRLFTPFYTSKKHGQGLGLMLVKEILTQHGFGFSLEAADGKTHFRIEMPAV
jgi:two-component system, NtrC family, nitrogen regulation sensor histidine kinase NtrY